MEKKKKKKRKLILSEKQLNEIIGGAYFSNSESVNPKGTEVTASSPRTEPDSTDGNYPAKKMDDYSSRKANNLGGYGVLFGSGYGRGPITLREEDISRIVSEELSRYFGEKH